MKNMVVEQVNLKTIITKRLKNNFKLEIFIKNSFTFTEKLI
jgi:hypothetical protein